MVSKTSQAIRREFDELLDKCQHSFARLRDLPPVGRQSWEPCFQEAFNVFSRLWKFQQEHRAVLIAQGLKRWEIGGIASKIGQLYYNYYLRTSDTHFLQESYMFYEAIHARQYFQQALNDPTVTIKQLRYCVRFIIVCLLLNLREEVWQLVQELEAHVRTYIMKFHGADTREWQLVMDEVTSFLHGDVALPPPRTASSMAPIQLRLRCSPVSAESGITAHKPCLREAILSSYYPRQVKIAELPLDSFRMLQVLEWEPLRGPASASIDPNDSSTNTSSSRVSNPTNPPKLVFHKATAPQLLSALAAVCEQPLPPDNVILVYVSGLSPTAALQLAAAGNAAGVGIENGPGGSKLRGLGVAGMAHGPAAGLSEELRRLKLSQGGDRSKVTGVLNGLRGSIPEDTSITRGLVDHRVQADGKHGSSEDTQEEDNKFEDDDDDDVFGMEGGDDMQPSHPKPYQSRQSADDHGSRPGPARVLFPVQSLLELQAAGEQVSPAPAPATQAGELAITGPTPATHAGDLAITGPAPATIAGDLAITAPAPATSSGRESAFAGRVHTHATKIDSNGTAMVPADEAESHLQPRDQQDTQQGSENDHVPGTSTAAVPSTTAEAEGAAGAGTAVGNSQPATAQSSSVSVGKGTEVKGLGLLGAAAAGTSPDLLETAPSENVPQVRLPVGNPAGGVGGRGPAGREVVPGTSWEELASKAGSSWDEIGGKLPGSWDAPKAQAGDMVGKGGNASASSPSSVLAAAGQEAVYLSGRRGYPTADCLLFPEDLLPFTRRPLLLVVDSDASAAFKRLQGKEHVSPLLCMLSPPQHPSSLIDPTVSGRLLTMFLSVPSMALCVLCRTHSPSVQKLQGLQEALDDVMKQWGAQLLQALITERSPWAAAFRDVLLRRVILRFVLCRAALSRHKDVGKSAGHIPSCFPDLPACADPSSPLIVKGLESLTSALGTSQLFAENT